MSTQDGITWDFDNDEIASIGSEELHENRPNRWHGARSTWRELTRDERDLWKSINQSRASNLSIHLYNAHALKRTSKAQTQEAENNESETTWEPPKMWTAWPLKPANLPQDTLLPETQDGNSAWTVKRDEDAMPSSKLEEELVATMLRQAKKRFSKRNTAPPHQETSEIKQSIEQSDASQTDDQDSLEDIDDSDSDEDAEGKIISSSPVRKLKPTNKTYQPIMSANDDRSTAILKPSARHILTHLDDTLSILHKMRSTAQHWMSESSEAETSDSQTSQKRKVGRPRLPAAAPGASYQPKGNARGRGRPKKVHIPLEGETEEEMQIRLARQNHRRLPYTEEEKQEAFGDWLRKGDERLKKQVDSDADDAEVADAPTFNAQAQMHRKAVRLRNRRKKIRRWGVRDWSDVLAAASLAGFSGEVIQRTAARCATMFHENIYIDQLDEVAAAKPKAKGKAKSTAKPAGFKSTLYNPQPTVEESETSSSDEEETAAQTLKQRRVAARNASLAQASRESSRGRSPFYPSSESGVAASRSGSRSRSTSSTRVSYCPISTCSRAAAGFTRKTNLRRHMRLVHPDVGDDWVEEDSDDQMHGAVHVDGFLQRIKMQKGWRGQDLIKRKRRTDHDDLSARSSPRKRRASSDDYV